MAGGFVKIVVVIFFGPPMGVGGECERKALNGHFLDVTYPSEWLQGEKKDGGVCTNQRRMRLNRSQALTIKSQQCARASAW